MSFYRTFITAIAAMGLATSVFAADDAATAPAADASATATATEATASTEATSEKVNVNKATAKELAKVKGLTAAQAKSIVSYRKKHGDFKSLDDLKLVKGLKKMNEEKLKSVQDQLTAG